MAITSLGGVGVHWPHDYIMEYSSTMTQPILIIDATGEKIAMIGPVWTPDGASKDIRKIGFLFGTVTKTGGSGLTVSLQDVTADLLPDETQDETVAIANADAGFVSNAFYVTGNLSADRTVDSGEMLAVVVEYDGSGRQGSDTVTLKNFNAEGLSTAQFSKVSLKTASWTDWNSRHPIVLFEFSDGSFGTLHGGLPISADNVFADTQSDTTPDELALKFTVPFTMEVEGFYFEGIFISGASSDFDVVLYEDSTTLETVSFDATNFTPNTLGAYSRIQCNFAAVHELTTGKTYRLAMKGTDATSGIRPRYVDVADADYFDVFPGGNNFTHSERTDGGAWSDTATRKWFGGLIVSGVDIGAGGGAGGPSARNLLIGSGLNV